MFPCDFRQAVLFKNPTVFPGPSAQTIEKVVHFFYGAKKVGQVNKEVPETVEAEFFRPIGQNLLCEQNHSVIQSVLWTMETMEIRFSLKLKPIQSR